MFEKSARFACIRPRVAQPPSSIKPDKRSSFIQTSMEGSHLDVLTATTKHYLHIGQPITLFNYLVDSLVENNKFSDLDIEDRVNFLQNSLANLENLQVSEEFLAKKKWVDHIIQLMML